VGDRIRIKGHTTDFEQTVDSIQVEHATVQKVGIGDEVGIKVKERVHEHDTVYVVRE
jgi:translation initiation factor IF-2